MNLGWALAQNGRRVLLVDGDLGLANIDILLALPVQKTIRDILQSGGNPLDALIHLTPNYAVLPASSGVPDMVALGPDDQTQLGGILGHIGAHFDYVLMDTAAGIGSSVIWFNTFADHSIVIFTPDPTSLTDAYALIKILARDYGRTNIHLLVNFVSGEQEALQIYQTLARVTKQFLNLSPVYLGSIPYDNVVSKAVREQSPFLKEAPSSKAAQAIQTLADRVLAMRQ